MSTSAMEILARPKKPLKFRRSSLRSRRAISRLNLPSRELEILLTKMLYLAIKEIKSKQGDQLKAFQLKGAYTRRHFSRTIVAPALQSTIIKRKLRCKVRERRNHNLKPGLRMQPRQLPLGIDRIDRHYSSNLQQIK